MYPLTHMGIACGVVWAGSRIWDRLGQPRGAERANPASGTAKALLESAAQAAPSSLSRRIDYRLVAMGAMLPDLIDKPLALLLRHQIENDGHIFAHTLLFPLALALPGLFLARRGDPRLLTVAVASLTHVLVDPVAREPRTLFWPLLGLDFPDVRGLNRVWLALMDGVAAVVALMLARWLHRRGRLWPFLRQGRLT